MKKVAVPKIEEFGVSKKRYNIASYIETIFNKYSKLELWDSLSTIKVNNHHLKMLFPHTRSGPSGPEGGGRCESEDSWKIRNTI